ncbi:MAG: hypothetical protein IKT28_05910 [Rikenellaceae bacterium]|nr:hypothetical protein [Rikenellaceae bacterium]
MKMYQGESCDITLKITDDNGEPFALGDKCLTLFLTRRGEIVPGVRATTRQRDGYLLLADIGGGYFLLRLGAGQTASLEGDYTLEVKLTENESCQIAKCESVTFMPAKIGKFNS